MKNVSLRLLLVASLVLFTSAIPSSNAGVGSSIDVGRISGRNTQRLDLSAAKVQDEEFNNEYWHDRAKVVLKEQIEKAVNTNKAKNIIFFLGDGMGHQSVAAARMLLGDENKKLSFEEFPFTANSKTYCMDLQVADSACTSTAYLSGVKARGSTIGLNALAEMGNCFDTMNTTMHTESIASWAMKAGKDAGIVTTTRVTHASPAGAYSHVAYRHWEYDYSIDSDGCSSNYNDDIAEQLIHGEVGKKLKVIFGCGSRNFVNRSMVQHNLAGYRRDGKNLLNDYLQMNPSRLYVTDREQLQALDATKVDEVLGLFDSSHCTYALEVSNNKTLQEQKPSLTDMTKKAVEILRQNENGYFLFVEGGRIDHGHHETRSKYALSETVEFSKAIQAAVDMVDLDDTLIIVTADHSHAFSISGYAPRGNDIYGFAGTADDNMPYMTLSYANGPGYNVHWNETANSRVDPSKLDRAPNNFRFPTPLPRVEDTHGGEDVGIWAVGPWAHLFQGTLEQHVIPHILAYASCIGDGMTVCDK